MAPAACNRQRVPTHTPNFYNGAGLPRRPTRVRSARSSTTIACSLDRIEAPPSSRTCRNAPAHACRHWTTNWPTIPSSLTKHLVLPISWSDTHCCWQSASPRKYFPPTSNAIARCCKRRQGIRLRPRTLPCRLRCRRSFLTPEEMGTFLIIVASVFGVGGLNRNVPISHRFLFPRNRQVATDL